MLNYLNLLFDGVFDDCVEQLRAVYRSIGRDAENYASQAIFINFELYNNYSSLSSLDESIRVKPFIIFPTLNNICLYNYNAEEGLVTLNVRHDSSFEQLSKLKTLSSNNTIKKVPVRREHSLKNETKLSIKDIQEVCFEREIESMSACSFAQRINLKTELFNTLYKKYLNILKLKEHIFNSLPILPVQTEYEGRDIEKKLVATFSRALIENQKNCMFRDGLRLSNLFNASVELKIYSEERLINLFEKAKSLVNEYRAVFVTRKESDKPFFVYPFVNFRNQKRYSRFFSIELKNQSPMVKTNDNRGLPLEEVKLYKNSTTAKCYTHSEDTIHKHSTNQDEKLALLEFEQKAFPLRALASIEERTWLDIEKIMKSISETSDAPIKTLRAAVEAIEQQLYEVEVGQLFTLYSLNEFLEEVYYESDAFPGMGDSYLFNAIRDSQWETALPVMERLAKFEDREIIQNYVTHGPMKGVRFNMKRTGLWQ